MDAARPCADARPRRHLRCAVRRRLPPEHGRRSFGAVPARCRRAVLAELHDSLDGAFVSLFAIEHGRLGRSEQRGYSVIPDGISIEQGVTGRAIRVGQTQFVASVAADDDFVAAFPGMASELAVPLQAEYGLVGMLNVETTEQLPAQASRLVRKLAIALGPAVAELRAARRLDIGRARAALRLPELGARPLAIAEIAAASLSAHPLDRAVQLFVRAEDGGLTEQFALSNGGRRCPRATPGRRCRAALEASDQSAPLVVVDVRDELAAELAEAGAACAVLVPLRANGDELGVLVGTSREPELAPRRRTPTWPRCSARTRRLRSTRRSRWARAAERAHRPAHRPAQPARVRGVARHGTRDARETRRPLSLLVLDCDDFKEINDRAGHEFGDALLAEIGRFFPTVIPSERGRRGSAATSSSSCSPPRRAEAADAAATEVRQRLAAGLDPGGFPVRLSAGLATYPYDGGGASQLLRAADQALYEAKAAGKNRHAAYRDVVRQGAGLAPATQPAGRQRGDAKPPSWRTPARRRSRSGSETDGRRRARPPLPRAHLRDRRDRVLRLAREGRPAVRRRSAHRSATSPSARRPRT